MKRNLLLIGLISTLAAACSEEPAVTPPSATVATKSAVNTQSSSASADEPAPAAAVKPAVAGPKRVAIAAADSTGKENIALAPGESKQFVVSAVTGQIFMVDTDSKDLEISMAQGKDAAQLKQPGYYDSTLLENGDFVFQVKNTSKRDVQSAMTVVVSHTGISKR